MALYRRFAVYLYQYQGAKKGAGAGFGMIELRDGRIRMQLTGRGSVAQGNLDVYGLLDAPEDMAGIRLGSMQAGHFVLEAGDSIGEGKFFSDLRGIVLTSRPGVERAVAALWNGTFDAARFVQWKAPEAGVAEEEEIKVQPLIAPLEEIEDNSAEETMPEEEAEENPQSERSCSENLEENPQEEICCSEDFAGNSEEGMTCSEDSVENPMESSVEEATSTEHVEELIPETNLEDSQLHLASAALDLVEFGLPLEIEQEKPRPVRKTSESVLWQRLFKQYPKMKIPMQGESVLCLRIRPCDINRLPKANWKYGCSHFLARHYNRYRCLIVGRVLHEDGFEYFMGIPGGNTTQERMQAAEAGFDHYIEIERISPQWPEGFWLVQLQWED